MTLNRKYTDEIDFTADIKSKLSDLGYKSTTFEDLLVEIIKKSDNSAQVKKVEDKVNKVSTETLKANTPTFGLGTGSVDAMKMSNRAAEFKLEGNSFTYDLTKLKKDLPTGYSFISGGATVTDTEGKQTSAKGSLQTLKLNSLPSTVVITATVRTENGTMNLDRTVLLTKDVNTSATLDVRDNPAADTDLTQAELNTLLVSELILLKQK